MGVYEENYADYDNYEECTEAGFDGAMGGPNNTDGNKGEKNKDIVN